jgi:hyperosmotically inducible periplasmic protein
MIRCVALLLAFVLCLAAVFAQKGVKGDGEIHDQVLIRLAGDQDVKGTGINVEVQNGVVTLTGKVESEKIRSKAGKLAKKVKGVKSVDNKLSVGPR